MLLLLELVVLVPLVVLLEVVELDDERLVLEDNGFGAGFEDEFPALPPNAKPLPPAMGDQAGSCPGTQSEIGGLVSLSRFGLYAPLGYVGHPLAAYAA